MSKEEGATCEILNYKLTFGGVGHVCVRACVRSWTPLCKSMGVLLFCVWFLCVIGAFI